MVCEGVRVRVWGVEECECVGCEGVCGSESECVVCEGVRVRVWGVEECVVCVRE